MRRNTTAEKGACLIPYNPYIGQAMPFSPAAAFQAAFIVKIQGYEIPVRVLLCHLHCEITNTTANFQCQGVVVPEN